MERDLVLNALKASVKQLENLTSTKNKIELLEKINKKLVKNTVIKRKWWKEREEDGKKCWYSFYWDSHVYQQGYADMVSEIDIKAGLFN